MKNKKVRQKKEKRNLLDYIILFVLSVVYGFLACLDAIWSCVTSLFYFIKKNFFKILIVILISVALYIVYEYMKDVNEVLHKTTDIIETLNNKIESQNTTIDNLKLEINEIGSKKEEKKTEVAKVTTRGTTSRSGSSLSSGKYVSFNVSAYCACVKCCGKTNGITASGAKAQSGVTIAAPSKYAFGTKIYLEGMGTYTVQDRGGAIQGNKLDVYFDSHSEALKFGRKTVKGYVVE